MQCRTCKLGHKRAQFLCIVYIRMILGIEVHGVLVELPIFTWDLQHMGFFGHRKPEWGYLRIWRPIYITAHTWRQDFH